MNASARNQHARDEDALTGKVALVTGGTRGIGAAISRSLASRGAVVAAGFSRNAERADEFRRSLETAGAGASVHQGNVGDPEDCLRVVGEVIEQHGRLDILVNNAGVTVDRPILAMTVDDWHTVLRVNLSGAFYMSKPALEHMIERGSGRIIKSCHPDAPDRPTRGNRQGRGLLAGDASAYITGQVWGVNGGLDM